MQAKIWNWHPLMLPFKISFCNVLFSCLIHPSPSHNHAVPLTPRYLPQCNLVAEQLFTFQVRAISGKAQVEAVWCPEKKVRTQPTGRGHNTIRRGWVKPFVAMGQLSDLKHATTSPDFTSQSVRQMQ